MTMEILNDWPSHGGRQLVVRHASEATGTDMTFGLFLPPGDGPHPLLVYLSGLTCTHANAMEKGEYRSACAAHGIAFLCPDTSPRGEVSGARKAIPCAAQAARYSPFSITLAWVQVRPDR